MPVIRGRVVDASGRPVPLAAVYVLSAPEPQRDIAQLTAADGSFAISVRALGTYVLGARSDTAGDGRTTVDVTAKAGDVQAHISLPAEL